MALCVGVRESALVPGILDIVCKQVNAVEGVGTGYEAKDFIFGRGFEHIQKVSVGWWPLVYMVVGGSGTLGDRHRQPHRR